MKPNTATTKLTARRWQSSCLLTGTFSRVHLSLLGIFEGIEIMEAKIQEAGTKIFVTFEANAPFDRSVTMNMFTQDSIEVKIWEGKHKCTAQAFIGVEELLNATNLFNKLRIDGIIKS